MTIWYVDPENGTDASASAGVGDSYATRRKSPNNIGVAALAPGDVIRIMASPDPTSLGQTAQWTSGAWGSSIAMSVTSNATPIVVTTSGAHGLSTGDTVAITGHSTNTNANGVWEVNVLSSTTFELINADGSNSVGNGVGGSSGTLRKINSSRVMLTTAVTQNIALCGNSGMKPAWTAAANVTTSVASTPYKEGKGSLSVAAAAGFTAGMAAYYALPSTLNLSGYEQISFQIQQTAGTLATAGQVTIRLCSDTAGVTTVNTFSVPVALVALSQWVRLTIDNAAALGNAIASIAIDLPAGARTFLLDNIIACKAASAADSLSLTSLIGKNATNETWYGVQSINGRRLVLDRGPGVYLEGASVNSGMGVYTQTTEAVTTYKRETTKLPMVTGNTAIYTVQDSGTATQRIQILGGWNRTDMSTRTGESWLDCQNGAGTLIGGQQDCIDLDRFNAVRVAAHSVSGSAYMDFWSLTNCHAIGCGFGSGQLGGWSYENCFAVGSGEYGFQIGGNAANLTFKNVYALGNFTAAIRFDGTGVKMDGVTVMGTINGPGLSLGNGNGIYIKNLTSNLNLASIRMGGVNNAGGSGAEIRLKNAVMQETLEVDTGTNQAYSDYRIYSENHDNTAGNHVIFVEGGLITAEYAVRYAATGMAWKIAVTGATRSGGHHPLSFEIAKVAVAANALVTVSARMQRTNTGLTHQLVCKGGQIAGVTTDVVSAMTEVADTWELVTITFTPTEAGVVSITTESYGGTTYSGYVDDLSITQA